MLYTLDKELDILSFMVRNPAYFIQNVTLLKKFRFNDDKLNTIFASLNQIQSKYGELPTESELASYVVESIKDTSTELDLKVIENYVREIFHRSITSVSSASLEGWLIQQEKDRIADKLRSLKPEEISASLYEIEADLHRLNLMHFDKDDLGCDMFSDKGIEESVAQITAYHKELCIPSGYTLLDEKLEGGFRKGEICLLLAPPNAGKTLFLVNMAVRMVKQGYRVVYMALDNIPAEMKKRLLSVFLEQGIEPSAPDYDPNDVKSSISGAFGNLKGKFHIKHFAPQELTKTLIDRYLNRLKTYMRQTDPDWEIDVLIVDYFELMKGESKAGEFWIQAEHLAQNCKAVALNHNLFFLSATQGGTEAMKAETVQMWQAAGAKARFNQPDLVFSLSSTLAEKLETQPIVRMTNLKARRKDVAYQIRFRFDKLKHKVFEDPQQTVSYVCGGNAKASEAELDPSKILDGSIGKYKKKAKMSETELLKEAEVENHIMQLAALVTAKESAIEEVEVF